MSAAPINGIVYAVVWNSGPLEEPSTKLRNIMTEHVEVIPPDATIGDAAKKMRDLDVGALSVCDGKLLCGIITDRDIAIRAVADGLDSYSPVRDAMTDDVVYCFDDQDYEDAAALMREHEIRRLPVVNSEKCLVGVVSLADLSLKGE
jgi:CBS domain-containing protein